MAITELDERKLKILHAIIRNYLETGEPVGSRTISKAADLNVSSATIRNDMAVLEQLGLLEQPHTSAGRVPTFQGYKLYIEKCMPGGGLPEDEKQRLDSMFADDALTEDGLIQSATSALAEITKCAAVAVNAMPQFSVISNDCVSLVSVWPSGASVSLIV